MWYLSIILLCKISSVKSLPLQFFLIVIFFIYVSTDLIYLPLFVIYVYSFFSFISRIPGFHPGGPGSTPGMGTHFLRSLKHGVQSSVFLFLLSNTKASASYVESIKVRR